MNPNNLVCRTCLGVISEGKIAHSIDEENGIIRNVRNIREMIVFCIPEMDIYISVSPIICDSCLRGLVTIYNYKIRCLRVENAIRSYIVANNVMEGSCVNLNNVVRQQIVEALKKKNWPPDLIKEYVDKNLCAAKTPTNRPKATSEVFQTMAQNFNAPRILNNTGPRFPDREMSAILNNINASIPSMTNPPQEAIFRPSPSQSNSPQEAIFRPPPTQYLTVSTNLMPPKPVQPPLAHQQVDINYRSSYPNLISTHQNVPVPSQPVVSSFVEPPLSLPAVSSAPSSLHNYQNIFMNTLQLVSNANEGRQEAVILQTKEKPKRISKPRKPKGPQISQNVIPPKPDNSSRRPASNRTPPKPVETQINRTGRLSPTTGIFRQDDGDVANKTVVENVKTYSKAQRNNQSKDVAVSDEIIILDDDMEPEKAKRNEGQLLVRNSFGENENVVADKEKQGASITPKKMVIRLPMIDKETLKRKLKPEDVIDEIQSKRRKLVVKLNTNLPYLHKNKRLVVKIRKDTFVNCTFCRFATINREELREHDLKSHKVCSRCQFKCNSRIVLSQHLNAKHPHELEQVLKRYEEQKLDDYCGLCNYTGLSEVDLREHRLRIHVKCDTNGMYKCPVLTCKYELPLAHDVVLHIERKHDKDKNTQCPLCNFTAMNVKYLKHHVATHSLAKLKCTYCDFWSRTAFSLKMHVNKKHAPAASQSTTGMVYTELEACNTDGNTDYRVTLDTLQPRAPETRPNTSSSASKRTLDQYEFALPSLSEILCSQEMSIENPDQDECTIVSDAEENPASQEQRLRVSRKSTVINKKNKKSRKSNAADDPEDCIIIPQVIPTVDLSDDEDCVVVSQDVGVATENSSQASVVNVNVLTNQKPQDSETDTCPEISSGAETISPQGTTSETETSSELSASEILRNVLTNNVVTTEYGKESVDKTVNSEVLENDNLDKGQTISSEKSVTEETTLVDAQTQKSAQSSTYLDDSSGREATTNDNISTFSKTNERNSNSDEGSTNRSEKPSEPSENPSSPQEKLNTEDKNTPNTYKHKESPTISEKSNEQEIIGNCETDLIQLLNERYSDTMKDSEPAQLDSVLIESSDDDSNDCTFVANFDTQQYEDKESLPKKVDDPFDSDGDQSNLSTQKDKSKVSEGTSEIDNSEVSQKKLETDVPSRAVSGENDTNKEISEKDKEFKVSEKQNSEEAKCDNQDTTPTNSEDLADKISVSESSELPRDSVDIESEDVSEILNSDTEMENIETSKNNEKSCDKEEDTHISKSSLGGSEQPSKLVSESDTLEVDAKIVSENTNKPEDGQTISDQKENDSNILSCSIEEESEGLELENKHKESDLKKDKTDISNSDPDLETFEASKESAHQILHNLNDSEVLFNRVNIDAGKDSDKNKDNFISDDASVLSGDSDGTRVTLSNEKEDETKCIQEDEDISQPVGSSELEKEVITEEIINTDSNIEVYSDVVKDSDTNQDNIISDDASVPPGDSDSTRDTLSNEKEDETKCIQEDEDILQPVGSSELEKEIVTEEIINTDLNIEVNSDAVKDSDTNQDNIISDDALVPPGDSDGTQNTLSNEKGDKTKCIQEDEDILQHVGSSDLTASEENLDVAECAVDLKEPCSNDVNSSEPISYSEVCEKDFKGETISDNTCMGSEPENVNLDVELKMTKD